MNAKKLKGNKKSYTLYLGTNMSSSKPKRPKLKKIEHMPVQGTAHISLAGFFLRYAIYYYKIYLR